MIRTAQQKPFAPVRAGQYGKRSMVSGRPTDVEIHISLRAYQLYSARGAEDGHDLEDWLRAEKEVVAA